MTEFLTDGTTETGRTAKRTDDRASSQRLWTEASEIAGDSEIDSCSNVRPGEKMAAQLTGIFQELDSNKDGFVNIEEIDRGFLDSGVSDEEAALLVMLKDSWSELDLICEDGVDLDSGFSKNDIDEFSRLASDPGYLAKLTINVYRGQLHADSWKSLDDDGDRLISRQEIDAALNNEALNPSLRLPYTLLKGNYDAILDDSVSGSEDKISVDDIKSYYSGLEAKLQSYNAVAASFDPGLKTTDRLFANNDDPVKSIRPEAVLQGRVGDCHFQASLAALAGSQPERIRDMISFNQSTGMYTVTFPGDKNHPLTIAPPTPAEQAYFSGGTKDGMWPVLLEKAYGMYMDVQGSHILPGDTLDEGACSERALRLLTGETVQTVSFEISHPDTVHQILTRRMKDKQPVSAEILKAGSPMTGLVNTHAYSVTGYDAETRMVTLRNPWGRTEPTIVGGAPVDGVDDGIFKLPLDVFCDEFSYMLSAVGDTPDCLTPPDFQDVLDRRNLTEPVLYQFG